MEPNRLKPTILASTMFKGGVLASFALLGIACSNDSAGTAPDLTIGTPGIVAGTLEVSAVAGGVKLRNTTEQQIGFAVLDKDQFVIAIYPLCIADCLMLPQGVTATVPFSLIAGYNPQSTEAVVVWWRYIVRADGMKVPDGSQQTTTVKLK